MESSKKRRVVATFPWRSLRAPLSDEERGAVRQALERLLRWQASLGAFPRVKDAPNATPFVSIYARGKLYGCMGTEEGAPGERLCRAFLRALEDVRFGTIFPEQRRDLTAQVSYPIDPEEIDLDSVAVEIEPGTHGIACVREGAIPVNLLPMVARDNALDPPRFLELLGRKAGLGGARFQGSHIFRFRTEDVAATQQRAPSAFGDPIEEACDWLARLIASDGRIEFAIDPRSRKRMHSGIMRHGRLAVALQALAGSKLHARHVARAKSWLEREIASALRGDAVEGWPDHPAVVAGTLALASQAGIDLAEPLSQYANKPELAANAWHAAQVISVLAKRSPAQLVRACVADLDHRPWAPWSLLAARALGDAELIGRCERPLVEALRSRAPHRGGASVTSVPETALTAISIEALAGLRSKEAKSAALRGQDFLRRWQLRANVAASLDPLLCRGAFPASPVQSLLRCDITAHAVLALSGVRPTS
jgi:AMMECR1 domain-containing protein